MRKFIIGILCLSLFTPAWAEMVSVHGSVSRKTGKYRKPYHRTAPNKTKMDNWSTRGHVNPLTGKKGSNSPSAAPKHKTNFKY